MMFTTNLMSSLARSFYWRRCFIKPAFCVVLSLVYFHTNVLFLYAAQSDFWAERRKAVEAFKNQNNTAFNPAVPNPNSAIPKLLAQLPVLQTSLSVIATPQVGMWRKQSQVTPDHEIATPPLATRNDNKLNKLNELNKLILPYAEVKETYLPNAITLKHNNSTTPLAVIIQDVHQHYEAQKNIANVLNVVAQFIERRSKHDTATTPDKSGNYNRLDEHVVIGVEGAVGPFDFSPYRAYSDKKLTADIADSFMKEGMIGGPEFYGITVPDNQLMPMIGVEDEKLYLDNIQAFKDSLPLERQVKIEIEKRQKRLKDIKNKIFNKELLEIDTKREQYHEGKLNLGDYLTALVSAANGSRRLQPAHIKERRINPAATTKIYPSVCFLVEAYHIEKTLDFTKVDKERAQIIEVLSKKLSKTRLNELVQVSLAYRTGNITYAQFYAIFKAMAQDAGINFDVFPEMSQYIKYVLLTDKIDKNRLFDEIIQLEKSLENHLAKTPEEKQLLAQSKYLELVKKLVEFSLTPEEWKQYKSLGRSVVAQFIERRLNATDNSTATTPDEWGNYTATTPDKSGNYYNATTNAITPLPLKSFEKFYETALKRNEALVSNLLRQVKNETGKGKEQGSRRLQPAHSMERRIILKDESALPPDPATTNLPALNSNSSFSTFTSTCRFSVLIAGGFHTNGLTQILKQKNVPYVVLTPNITKVEEGQQSLELLARGKTPLEKLFTGEKIFLVAPLKLGVTNTLGEDEEAKKAAVDFGFAGTYTGVTGDSRENFQDFDIRGPVVEKNYGTFQTRSFGVATETGEFKTLVVTTDNPGEIESLPTYKEAIENTKELMPINVSNVRGSIRKVVNRGNLIDNMAHFSEQVNSFVQTRISGIRNNDIFKKTLSMVGFSISFILTSKLLALAFVAVGLPVSPGVFTLFTVVRLAVSLSFSILLPALIKKLTKSEKLGKYSTYCVFHSILPPVTVIPATTRET